MIKTKLSLAELRQHTSLCASPTPPDRLKSSSYLSGIPCGVLTEITGTAKIEWLFQFLAENPEHKVLWLESTFRLLPPAALQRGVNLNQIIFVETKTDIFAHLRRAIQSQVFKCIIAPSAFAEMRLLNTLRVITKHANVATLLVANTPTRSWTIGLQLDIHRDLSGEGLQVRDEAAAATALL